MKKICLVLFMVSILFFTGCDFGNNEKYKVTKYGNTTSKTYVETVDLSFEKFKNKLDNNETFILLVYRTGCSHCQSFEPKLNKVIERFNLELYSINTDEITEKEQAILTNKTFVEGTPTMVFFKEGKNQRNIKLIGDRSEQEIISFLINAEFLEEK